MTLAPQPLRRSAKASLAEAPRASCCQLTRIYMYIYIYISERRGAEWRILLLGALGWGSWFGISLSVVVVVVVVVVAVVCSQVGRQRSALATRPERPTLGDPPQATHPRRPIPSDPPGATHLGRLTPHRSYRPLAGVRYIFFIIYACT